MLARKTRKYRFWKTSPKREFIYLPGLRIWRHEKLETRLLNIHPLKGWFFQTDIFNVLNFILIKNKIVKGLTNAADEKKILNALLCSALAK